MVHQLHKYYGNPVYTVQMPWEGTGVVYLGGVYIDPADRLWKAWYVSLHPPEYLEIIFAVCIIFSEDGIHWYRPELDVYRSTNGEKTNIVLSWTLGKYRARRRPALYMSRKTTRSSGPCLSALPLTGPRITRVISSGLPMVYIGDGFRRSPMVLSTVCKTGVLQ